MLDVNEGQLATLTRESWNALGPRVDAFLAESFPERWGRLNDASRNRGISAVLDECRRLGFRRVASVFKFAGLVVATEGRIARNADVTEYLVGGPNPDLRLEYLVISLSVAERLAETPKEGDLP